MPIAEDREHSILRSLARGFVQHSKEQSLRGAKRDRAAMSYFQGAGDYARAIGKISDAHMIGNVMITSLSVRGYKGVLDILEILGRGEPP